MQYPRDLCAFTFLSSLVRTDLSRKRDKEREREISELGWCVYPSTSRRVANEQREKKDGGWRNGERSSSLDNYDPWRASVSKEKKRERERSVWPG